MLRPCYLTCFVAAVEVQAGYPNGPDWTEC